MALRCYPLQPGGLLVIESVLLGLTSADAVYEEALANFPVILLLMFMVAAIYFMQELLLFVFARVLLRVRSKVLLSLVFLLTGAVLSAFLDALTVTAAIIAVSYGFYVVFHRYASGRTAHDEHDTTVDTHVPEVHLEDLDGFRAFLRGLLMHGAVGTALGGLTTLVGEPQNLLIGKAVGWEFVEFFVRVAPVSMPVLAIGTLTCVTVERFHLFGFGAPLPHAVREVLTNDMRQADARRTPEDRARLVVQAIAAFSLVFALSFHIAEVGIIGLTMLIVQTALNGVVDEGRLGHAFGEALPFTALLIVFFGVVAIIHDQGLFEPIVEWALEREGNAQLVAFYVENGVLSAISDNVFVATIFISEVTRAAAEGHIAPERVDALAVAINAGTNIASVATPNGQAAFLFLLTSAVAPLVRLSYPRMVWMALPYTITMTLTGLLAVIFLLD
jgi:NhaB family Na+:H+ antiporter